MIEREQLISMVRGLQNGDEAAATQIYETFNEDIYYFILKTVNNDRELAEDLTQDTFVEILETIGNLQEPAAFVTWSKQIAYHKCTAYFKKRKELLVDENEDGYSVFDTVEEDREEFIPDAALDHDDLKQTIIKMINDLPEEQKSAILLRYFNEISVKEIAEIQGVTEGTVKSRLNYGRKSIKQAVEEYEKKNDIKLHCAGVLPLLLWLFKEYRVVNGLSLSAKTATHVFVIAEETATAAAVAATGTGTAAAATTATTATATTAATTASATATAASAAAVKTAAGVGLKLAGKALATKVIAGVVAATVAVGGVTAGVTILSESKETEPAYIETYENWAPETTLAFVIEETTLPSTEETTAPAEETVTETEIPAETVCQHTNTYHYVYQEGDNQIGDYAIVCADCDIILQGNLYYEPEGDAPNPTVIPTETVPPVTETPTDAPGEAECDHEWELVYELIGSEYVNKEYACTKCGEKSYEDYPNTCQHEYQFKEEVPNGSNVDQVWECTKCGLIYYNPQNSEDDTGVFICDHEWQYNEPFCDEFYCYQIRVCTVCGLAETASQTENPCAHVWTNCINISETTILEWESCQNCNATRNHSERENTCAHTWTISSSVGENEIVETEYCPSCNAVRNQTITPNPCAHVWDISWTAYDVTLIFEYEQCSSCQFVRRISERENPCAHTWQTVSWADENYVHQYEECTSCTAITNYVDLPNPCSHVWEELQVLDDNGNVIQTNYHCPNCDVYK